MKTTYEVFKEDNGIEYKFTLVIHTLESDMIIRYKDLDCINVNNTLALLEYRLENFLSHKINTFKTSDIQGLIYSKKIK